MNEKTLPLKMSSSEWVNHVKEFLTPADLEEDTLFAFLHYLADLKILVHCEKDTWRWNGILDPLKWEEQKLFMQNEIERASHTESGFALPYFIGYKNKQPTLQKYNHKKRDTFLNPSFCFVI